MLFKLQMEPEMFMLISQNCPRHQNKIVTDANIVSAVEGRLALGISTNFSSDTTFGADEFEVNYSGGIFGILQILKEETFLLLTFLLLLGRLLYLNLMAWQEWKSYLLNRR